MTPKFTLIAFHCNEIDLKNRLESPSELANILESTKEHRVEIYLGAYVFHTQRVGKICIGYVSFCTPTGAVF